MFNCSRCGKCCNEKIATRHHKTSFWISKDLVKAKEIAAIIKALGDNYNNEFSNGRFNLTEDGSCPFLKNGSCSIHDIMPSACRAYPMNKWKVCVSGVFETKD